MVSIKFNFLNLNLEVSEKLFKKFNLLVCLGESLCKNNYKVSEIG